MMSSTWPRLSVSALQDEGVLLVEDGNHGQYRPRRDEFGEGEYAFIRAADLDGGRVLFESAQRINSKAMERIRKGVGQGGDVLFSHKGTVGKLALAPRDSPPFVCSPQTTFWRALDQERIDRRYLYCYMQSGAFAQQWMARCNETDMAAYVSLTAQRQLNIAVPPIEEQRAIADVFGALDAKIEQNRQTALTLERLARTIFRAWFVDFEPVEAKADGETAFFSMPESAFDVLSARFVDSRIGPVPDGWEVKALDEVAAFLNGLALQKYPPRGDGSDLPVIKIAQLRRGLTEGADAANDSIDAKYKVQDGDLLFSWSGTLEAVRWFGGPGALNQHLFKVTSADYPQWLIYEWVHQHLPEFRQIAAGKATTMGHIKRGHLRQALVAVPPSEFLGRCDQVLSALFKSFAATQLESRKLVEIRDYLLSRLLIGEARVQVTRG
ncbi:restriction endonuclease subunit S [Candidatus Poriferisodalis sp.]|uniref:restriction endonuclease subunit S n=1 Tax=Candidatus Poriferisodalis sp. TaxID=3101277 RepID=UPI003B5B36A4